MTKMNLDKMVHIRFTNDDYDTLVNRAKELRITQSDYLRNLLSFEARSKLLGVTNIEGLDYNSVDELVKDKNESLSLREKLSEIQLRLDQRLSRINFIETSITDKLKKKKRSKKAKV